MRWAILFAAILFISQVSAHGAPEILDVEVQLIEDEANDATYASDGYDLQGLYMREAHWRQIGSDALILRIIAAGGAVSPAAGPSAIEFDLAVDGTSQTYRFETTDDATWTGDLDIVEATIAEGEMGETQLGLQVLLPTPDIAPGTTLSGFAMRSFSGAQMIDAAPGGLYGPAGEIPNSGGSTIAADLAWTGPTGYTASTVTQTEDTATITVDNTITVSGQHISLRIGDAEGWSVGVVGQQAVSAEAGQGLTFELTIDQAGTEPLELEVLTDLGGRELLRLAGTSDPEAPAPMEETPDEVDSPGAPLALVLLALLLARRN